MRAPLPGSRPRPRSGRAGEGEAPTGNGKVARGLEGLAIRNRHTPTGRASKVTTSSRRGTFSR